MARTIDDSYLKYDSDTRAKVRRLNSNVVISGTFVIIYGLWTAIKTILSVNYGQESLKNLLGFNMDSLSEEFIWTYTFLILIMLVVMYIHYRIGISAIRFGKNYVYGKKRKRKSFFIVFGAIYALIILLSNIRVICGESLVTGTEVEDFA